MHHSLFLLLVCVFLSLPAFAGKKPSAEQILIKEEVNRLLSGVKGVRVITVGDWVVIQGKLKDCSQAELVERVQSAYRGNVLNLVGGTREPAAVFSQPESLYPYSPPPPLPAEGNEILDEMSEATNAEYEASQKRIREIHLDAVERLTKLGKKLEKENRKADAEAVAARAREIVAVDAVHAQKRYETEDIGKKFVVEVTGDTYGVVWGPGPYTGDSHLGTAAVHAGLILPGEQATLEVEVIEGTSNYPGSLQNGVQTTAWKPHWVTSVILRKK